MPANESSPVRDGEIAVSEKSPTGRIGVGAVDDAGAPVTGDATLLFVGCDASFFQNRR